MAPEKDPGPVGGGPGAPREFAAPLRLGKSTTAREAGVTRAQGSPFNAGGPLKGVLLSLAYHADREGQAWPSRTIIAIEAGMDLRTVISATKRLEVLGLIEVEHSSGNRVNRYFLRVGEQCHAATGDGDAGTPSNRASTVTDDHRDGGAGDGDPESPDSDPGAFDGDPGAFDGDPRSPKRQERQKQRQKQRQRNPPPGGAGGYDRSTPKRHSRRTLPAAPPKGTPGLGKDGLREIKV